MQTEPEQRDDRLVVPADTVNVHVVSMHPPAAPGTVTFMKVLRVSLGAPVVLVSVGDEHVACSAYLDEADTLAVSEWLLRRYFERRPSVDTDDPGVVVGLDGTEAVLLSRLLGELLERAEGARRDGLKVFPEAAFAALRAWRQVFALRLVNRGILGGA